MQQYQPLYLKYRPQKLSELIGQEVVTRTLTNAIQYNKIVHAYLFCGPRGTGKTSTARILAKSLNCEQGSTIDPCNKCTSCISITNGNSLDVIEIDAASHRKVEDAEDLINRVNLGTYGSRFKIYIIDEVHMLTDHAFNALLKTLEEPPKNVVFILATTEEYKVIPTIISRCQRFDFKLVPLNKLEERIKDIANQESIKIDRTIIKFISGKAKGCLRDAISLLDQISVLQHEEKSIDPKEVFELFGTVDRNTLFQLVNTVLLSDRKNAIDLAESLLKSGKDIGELLTGLIELVIDLAKAKIDPEYKKVISKELENELDILEKIEPNHLLKIIDKLQNSQSKLRFAFSQELQFMVEIMSMMNEDKMEISALSTQPSTLNPQPSALSTQHSALPPEDVRQRTDLPGRAAPNDLDSTWNKIINSIESNSTKTLLIQSGSYLIQLTENVLEIGLSKDIFLPRLEKDSKKKEVIIKAVKTICQYEPQILKFRILPKENNERKEASSLKSSSIKAPAEENDFTRSIKDLLGATEIQ